MTASFQIQHSAMLLKYSGISFISGAVNHGFFSGERSLWTAAVGIVLFVVGAWMEHRSQNNQTSLFESLWVGTLLSIGLGFFTGGLQHFPDSPARSSWVVPLGFAVSVFALVFSLQMRVQRALVVYALGLGILVSVSSWGAYQAFEKHPEWAAGGHAHGDSTSTAHDDHSDHAKASATAHSSASALQALQVSRSININLQDSMKFTPDTLQVKAGETIRFVVRNAGKLAHEMVLGNAQDIAAHAKEMQAMSAANNQASPHQHSSGAGGAIAVSVPAGEMREWVVKFDEAIELEMACLVPGHLEAGMKGKLSVTLAGLTSAAAQDHSQHKH